MVLSSIATLIIHGTGILITQNPKSICSCVAKRQNTLCYVQKIEEFNKKYIKISTIKKKLLNIDVGKMYFMADDLRYTTSEVQVKCNVETSLKISYK